MPNTAPVLRKFESGAVRDADADTTRYDLISPEGMRRLAETYAEGAKKYDDHNWRKGMPFSATANHAIKHIFQYLAGQTDEDHLAHAAWGLFALMHFEKFNPEMNDLYECQPKTQTNSAQNIAGTESNIATSEMPTTDSGVPRTETQYEKPTGNNDSKGTGLLKESSRTFSSFRTDGAPSVEVSLQGLDGTLVGTLTMTIAPERFAESSRVTATLHSDGMRPIVLVSKHSTPTSRKACKVCGQDNCDYQPFPSIYQSKEALTVD